MADYFAKRHYIVYAASRDINNWRLTDVIAKRGSDEELKLIRLDITDRKSVFEQLSSMKPDVVVHTAANGSYNFERDRDSIFKTNLLGTMNVADAALHSGAKLFINTGSSSEYGSKNVAMREDQQVNPEGDYAISKALATEYCRFIGLKGMKTVTLRLFSAYGYYEERHRFVPQLVYKSIKNGKLVISNPNYVRDFIFIEDICGAYESIINRYLNSPESFESGSVFNIGSGIEMRLAEVLKIAESMFGHINVEINVDSRQKESVKKWVADVEKAAREIPWKPSTEISEGLEKMHSWLKEHISLYDNEENDKSLNFK